MAEADQGELKECNEEDIAKDKEIEVEIEPTPNDEAQFNDKNINNQQKPQATAPTGASSSRTSTHSGRQIKHQILQNKQCSQRFTCWK